MIIIIIKKKLLTTPYERCCTISFHIIFLKKNQVRIWVSTYADVIIPAVHAAIQPVNLALRKPAWSVNNYTVWPPSSAVDGSEENGGYVFTTSAWPWLAVDLGGPLMAERIWLKVKYGECQAWLNISVYATASQLIV